VKSCRTGGSGRVVFEEPDDEMRGIAGFVREYDFVVAA
jgi:hypothetical protein